jgi:hypothetical protein
MSHNTPPSIDEIIGYMVDYRNYRDAIEQELIDRGTMSSGELSENNAQMDALTDGLMDSITIFLADK